MCRGDGEFVQLGGTKTSDKLSAGYGLLDLVLGSHYSLGFFFEVVLNLGGDRVPITPSEHGAQFCKLINVSDLEYVS